MTYDLYNLYNTYTLIFGGEVLECASDNFEQMLEIFAIRLIRRKKERDTAQRLLKQWDSLQELIDG